MTSQRRNFVNCQNCDASDILCPRCKELLRCDTKFSQWIRDLPFPNNGKRSSCHNIDYVWFKFYDGWFITMEEKINSKEYGDFKSDLSQIQLHNLVGQMLEFASGRQYDISFGDWKREKKIQYKGHFVIIFSHNDPDNSDWIKINGDEYAKEDLINLLTFGKLTKPENKQITFF